SIGLVAVMAAVVGGPFAVLTGLLGGVFGFVGTLLGLSALSTKHRSPTVVMAAEGLRLLTKNGWFALPYDAVHQVSRDPGALGFRVPPPYHFVSVATTPAAMGGMSEEEGEILLAQVTAASQRARGLGPQKNDVT